MPREFDYGAYIAAFEAGDDEGLVDRFFADDLVFTNGKRDYRGKDGLRGFLAWAHDGVREVPRVQATARSGDLLFAEVDMDFHAAKPRPDFPFGALRPGDSLTVKFFVTYRLRDGLVTELRSMTWPAESGVTKLPRLGPSPSQRAAYDAYLAAFGAGEFERMASFYTDDVLLELGSVPPIRTPQGIMDFYRAMFERVRETVILHRLEASDERLVADITSRFTAIADAPDFVVGALARGEAIEVPLTVTYDLRGGLIAKIKGVRTGEARKLSAAEMAA